MPPAESVRPLGGLGLPEGRSRRAPESTASDPLADENLWQAMLRDVSAAKGVETRNLILLGDRGAGKSTLVRAWKGEDATGVTGAVVSTQTELALSYAYVNYQDEGDDDVVGRIGIWQLEGVEEYGDLLPFALSKDAWATSMVVVALDMSKPWTLEASATKWLGLVERLWTSLSLTPGDRDTLQENMNFLGRALSSVSLGGMAASGAVATEPQFVATVRRYWQSYRDLASARAASGAGASSTGAGASASSGVAGENASDVELPLDPGVLTSNLGLPIVLLCLKSDVTDSLRKQYDIGEAQLDFMQQRLRRIALQWRKRSLDEVVSRDSVMVATRRPAKVALLSEGVVGADGRRTGTGYPDDIDYADVIPPPEADKSGRNVAVVTAMEEQAFLESLHLGEGNAEAGTSPSASLLDRSKSPRSRAKPETPSKLAGGTSLPGSPAVGPETPKGGDPQTEVLQTFFKSLLLNKKPSTSALGSTGAGSTAPPASTAGGASTTAAKDARTASSATDASKS